VKELRSVIESKTSREDELQSELERLRRVSTGAPSQRASGITVGSSGTATQEQRSNRDSKSTVVSWRDREPRSPEASRRTLETMPESDAYSSTNESFCELCETSGHDILTCTNMFSSNANQNANANGSVPPPQPVLKTNINTLSPVIPQHDDKPAPLSPAKKSPAPAPAPAPVRIIPNPMESGPVAGKESGMINLEKWCGVCEREGHDSIDCPFEDAF
jgi:hypothetical protein